MLDVSYMAMSVILHVPGHLVVAFLLPRLASFDMLFCPFSLIIFHMDIMVSHIFQEELYELILETNKHCVELCKPGASIRQIHNHSVSPFSYCVFNFPENS